MNVYIGLDHELRMHGIALKSNKNTTRGPLALGATYRQWIIGWDEASPNNAHRMGF